GIQVIPIRIVLFDQLNLPGACPFLKPLFTANRVFRIVVLLEMNELRDAVPLRESWSPLLAMLIDTPDEIAGNANIQCSAEAGRKNVNPVALLAHRASVFTGSPAFAGDDKVSHRFNPRDGANQFDERLSAHLEVRILVERGAGGR